MDGVWQLAPIVPACEIVSGFYEWHSVHCVPPSELVSGLRLTVSNQCATLWGLVIGKCSGEAQHRGRWCRFAMAIRGWSRIGLRLARSSHHVLKFIG